MCDGQPWPYNAICYGQFDRSKTAELEHMLNACVWVKHGIIGQVSRSLTADSHVGASPEDYEVERCNGVPAVQTWEHHRIGPFVTTGGYDWNQVIVKRLESAIHGEGSIAAVQGRE